MTLQPPVGELVQLDVAGPKAPTDQRGVVGATPAPDASGLRARLLTLGCKVNQYETQYVRELLTANGYREAAPQEPADLAVVNTCTVTAEADRKSRQLIRQLARKNPKVKIVVMGCYAAADPDAVRRLPGVAAVVTDKKDLAGSLKPFGVKKSLRGIRRFEGRHRAFVKVQDGCILNCTFCIIPKVRPGLLSRPAEDVVEEVRGLVDAGYKEIVLTGIHLGHYGVDLAQGLPKSQWRRLWHLLERLVAIDGDFRLRLSSLEATEVTDDFVRVLADHQQKICPHLHLSLQSGSNRILKLMKRRYRIERFLQKCHVLRDKLDRPAFSTDVIVGFPGETESDFEQTLDAVREALFSKIHIFPFSPRGGTVAEHMAGKVAKAIVNDRRSRLSRLAEELATQYYRELLHRRLDMLVEGPDEERPGWMKGTACRYAPLRLKTVPRLAGELVPVVASRLCDGAVQVEPYFDPHESPADKGRTQ